jgi:hypothetical protein
VNKFIQCEQCKAELEDDKCEFAVYSHIINGEDHVFCCKKCAERYKKKRG